MKNIIFIFCGFIAVYSTQAQVASPKSVVIADKIVAVVGGEAIFSLDIQNSIEDLRRQKAPVPANITCLITEQSIISKLLMLQALKDSLPVSDEDVEAELDQRINEYIKKLGSKKAVEDYAGKSVDAIKKDAREFIREEKLARAMQQKITGNVKITPAEVQAWLSKMPQDSVPLLEPEVEVGRIVFYPSASTELEQYVINELNNYKRRVEGKLINFCSSATDANTCSEYDINRNNKDWDPAFVSAAFHLKPGEISPPVKSKFGFYLIQMVAREGDDAKVRSVFRPFPLTDAEINQAKVQLGGLRSDIMDKRITFKDAALQYSDDDLVKYSGPFFLDSEGNSFISVSQLEKDVADMIGKMDVGDISLPMLFVDAQNKKGVRIIYLKSRTKEHRLNLRDDYSKLARMALDEKKSLLMEKWIKAATTTSYIMIDDEWGNNCPLLKKYASSKPPVSH